MFLPGATDVARLYVLAMERGEAGARYHAVAEEGMQTRTIVETLAEGLGVPAVSLRPDEVSDRFGFMARFAGMDMPASSAWTCKALDWTPRGRDLISDLKAMDHGTPPAN